MMMPLGVQLRNIINKPTKPLITIKEKIKTAAEDQK